MRKIFHDPSWQAIGVILPVLISSASYLVFAPRATENTERRLAIIRMGGANLSVFPPALEDRAQILIDKKEEKNVRMDVYLIRFMGKDREDNIKAIDFETPITGRLSKGRKIISVEPSSKKSASFPYIDTTRNMLSLESLFDPIKSNPIKLDDHSFKIDPALMNYGEWYSVEILSAAEISETNLPVTDRQKGDHKKPAESAVPPLVSDTTITWDYRIVGIIPRPAELNLISDLQKKIDARRKENQLPDGFYTYISMEGWGVYLFGLLNTLNFVVLLLLTKGNRLVREFTLRGIGIIILISILSFAVSEILTDWIYNGRSLTWSFDKIEIYRQPLVSTGLLILNLLIIIGLIVTSFILKSRSKAAVPAATAADSAPETATGNEAQDPPA